MQAATPGNLFGLPAGFETTPAFHVLIARLEVKERTLARRIELQREANRLLYNMAKKKWKRVGAMPATTGNRRDEWRNHPIQRVNTAKLSLRVGEIGAGPPKLDGSRTVKRESAQKTVEKGKAKMV